MKICVSGAGYVGVSTAALLAFDNDVILYDNDKNKVDLIKNGFCPINDQLLKSFISKNKIKLYSTSNPKEAFSNKDIAVIATNTNPKENGELNVDSVIECSQYALQFSPNSTLVIRSTVPIGFTDKLKKILKNKSILFSPEFLRENSAFKDSLYPDRIIVGGENKKSLIFLDLLKKQCKNKSVQSLICESKEAEAIKLFANSYLALRISFFNQLATLCSENSLSVNNIIEGVCSDQRIGSYYNKPSFAFAGHCLEKDTRQLKLLSSTPEKTLFKYILNVNEDRIKYFVNYVKGKNPKVIGMYKLSVDNKKDSILHSASYKLLKRLAKLAIPILVYEPSVDSNFFNEDNVKYESNLNSFKNNADVILAEKVEEEILTVKQKIITPDLNYKEIESI